MDNGNGEDSAHKKHAGHQLATIAPLVGSQLGLDAIAFLGIKAGEQGWTVSGVACCLPDPVAAATYVVARLREWADEIERDGTLL